MSSKISKTKKYKNIIPKSNAVYSIGTNYRRWKELHVNNTVYVGDSSLTRVYNNKTKSYELAFRNAETEDYKSIATSEDVSQIGVSGGIPAGTSYGNYPYWDGSEWVVGGVSSIAIGNNSGYTGQADYSIAVGNFSGYSNQLANSVAIGSYAGHISQGEKSVAIGKFSGYNDQCDTSVAIGYESGYLRQQTNSVAIGSQAGYSNIPICGVAIGYQAGFFGIEDTSIVGPGLENTIAIGNQAGYSVQQTNSVAIGTQAGYNGQQDYSISVGTCSGYTGQGNYSVAIGNNAGYSSQADYSVAIGNNAGYSSQANYALAIGNNAGYTGQGEYSIAIGNSAGYTGQGDYSVAIGYLAGTSTQEANSIIINATGNELNGITGITGTLQIAPIRQLAINPETILCYDPSTCEISAIDASYCVGVVGPTGPQGPQGPVAGGQMFGCFILNAPTQQYIYPSTYLGMSSTVGTVVIDGGVNGMHIYNTPSSGSMYYIPTNGMYIVSFTLYVTSLSYSTGTSSSDQSPPEISLVVLNSNETITNILTYSIFNTPSYTSSSGYTILANEGDYISLYNNTLNCILNLGNTGTILTVIGYSDSSS